METRGTVSEREGEIVNSTKTNFGAQVSEYRNTESHNFIYTNDFLI
jgi:hypothetical protein